MFEPEITDRQQWLMVDGPEGIEYVPSTTVRMPTEQELDTMRASSAPLPTWHEFLSNKTIWQIKVVTGYGVRLSMPGYMDCTAWDVYTEARKAQRAARELEKSEA